MQINHTIQICNKNNKVKGSLTVDIEFIQEYIPMYVEAAKLTLGIAVVGIYNFRSSRTYLCKYTIL